MELDQAQLLKEIASFLEVHDIPYMLTGAWSVVYYGRPRASHDIDFVVELYESDVDRVLKALKDLSLEYVLQEELVQEAIEKKGMFNIVHSSTLLKLDFWLLKEDDFDKARFQRRKKTTLLDQQMVIPTSEDTILKKLLWYKESRLEKHLIDAAFVYQIQKEHLDMDYLKKWSKTQKTTHFLKRLEQIDLEKYL